MLSLNARFSELSALLLQTEAYWRPVAFHQPQLPWMAKHSQLVQKLLALSEQQVEHLASDHLALTDYLGQDIQAAKPLLQLSQLDSFTHKSLPAVNPRFYAGMPGRKWQQVNAFAACIEPDDLPLLEWCAGKSYLGFYLNHLQGNKVAALEWNKDLVEQANQRALRSHCDLCSYQVDVLSPQAEAYLVAKQQVVALHACGELHEQLLKLSVRKKVRQLYLAPCCYHKRSESLYQPLSQQAARYSLALNKSELHTAVMETVTAGATVQRQRKQLQIMRLAFDCLQRDLTNSTQFLDLPSLPAHWARASLRDFCLHCAELKQLSIPATIDWQHYWQRAEQRFKQVSAMDLVRFLFRRPLEVWLALDRALLLQEQGYQVELATFCPSHVTPRNILIKAQLQNASTCPGLKTI